MRQMYDAADFTDIPAGAQIVAWYPDFATEAEVQARFPGALLVSIARNAGQSAKMADVEGGLLTPAQVPGWVDARRDEGDEWPWCYVNRDNWPSVKGACRDAGIMEPLYVVSIPGDQTIPPGAIGVQWGGVPDAYDISNLADDIPGFDTGAETMEDEYMGDYHVVAAVDGNTPPTEAGYLLSTGARTYLHITDPQSDAAIGAVQLPGASGPGLPAIGTEGAPISLAMHQALLAWAASPSESTLPAHTHQVAEVPGPTGEPIAG